MFFQDLFWNNKKYIGIWILRNVFIVSILLWMAIIFGFSAADAQESVSTSDKIVAVVIEHIYPEYDSWPKEKQIVTWDKVSYVVRKVGHFGEYAILGLLVGGFLLTFKGIRNNIKLLLLSELFGVVYAITDEIHQGFVAGRSPQIRDVCIDSLGFLFALLFYLNVYILYRLTIKRMKHKNNLQI